MVEQPTSRRGLTTGASGLLRLAIIFLLAAPAARAAPTDTPTATVTQNAPGTADTISGTALNGATIKVYTSSSKTTLIVQGDASNTGAWGPFGIGDNLYSSVFVTAKKGGREESAGVTAVNDIAIATPTAVVAQNPPGTADRVTGTAEAGSTVRVYTSSARTSLIGSALAAAGSFDLDIGDNANGSIFVTASDPAGNESAGVAAANDIVAPSAPAIAVLQNRPGIADRVSGSAEAGALVRIYADSGRATLIATGVAAAGTFDLSIGDNRNATVFAVALDAAGNESAGVSGVNDIAAPPAPTASVAQNPPGLADRVSGTAEAGASVRVYTSAAKTTLIASAIAAAGAYDLSIGDNTNAAVFVVAADAAGNESPGASAVNDISAPAAPTMVVAQRPPGQVDRVSGSAEAGSTVRVYSDAGRSTLLASAVAAGGVYDLAIGDNLSAAPFAVAADAAGNESAGTVAVNDVAAPAAPSILVAQSAPGTPDTVSGQASAGARVRIYSDSSRTTVLASAIAGTSGSFGPLSIGDNSTASFFVTATDEAGNEGPGTSGANDIVAPGSPTALVAANAPGTLDRVSGSAEAAARVDVYTDATRAVLVASGVAAGGAYDLPIGNNARAAVFVTATDAAGNTSPGVTATNDIEAPASPSLSVVQNVPGTPDRVAGSAETGALVRVYADASLSRLVASGVASSGTFDLPIGDNANASVFVTVRDAAGNESNGVSGSNDIVAPAAPVAAVTQSAPGTADRVAGSAEAGSTIRVYDGPAKSRLVVSGPAIGGAFDLPIGDNAEATPFVTAVDAAGNESNGVSGSNDIAAPPAPVVSVTQSAPGAADRVAGAAQPGTIVKLYGDSSRVRLIASAVATNGTFELSIGDNVEPLLFVTATDAAGNESAGTGATNDIVAPPVPTLTVTQNVPGTADRVAGRCDAGSFVRVYSGPDRVTLLASGTAATGTYDFSIGDDTNGSVFITATDAAGNESAGVTGSNDITPPGAPALAVRQNPPGTADRVSGTAAAGATIRVYTDASRTRVLAFGTANSDGAYDISIGDNATATVFVTAVGGTGIESAGTAGTNDIAVAPAMMSVTQSRPGTADRVIGTAEGGAVVRIFRDSSAVSQVASGVAVGGVFDLPIGDNAVATPYAVVTDRAGNVSAGAGGLNDVVAPARPVAAIAQRAPGTADRVTGTAEAGSVVSAYRGASALIAAGIAAGGSFDLAIGDNAEPVVLLTATDTAGNGSAAAVLANDIVAPQAPTAAVTQSAPGAADRVSGSAEAGAMIRVYRDSSKAVLIASGSPYDFAIGDNVYSSVFVTAVDAAGNESAGTAALNDIAAPAAPSFTVLESAPGTADRAIGVAEAGATVRVYEDAARTRLLASGTAFAGTFDLAAGDNAAAALFVTAVDSAGNESPAASASNDIAAPAAPVASLLARGPGNQDRVSGVAAAGSLVRVYGDAARRRLLASTLTPDGRFTVDAGDNASESLLVTATDAAGNEGAGLALANDISAPAIPDAVVTQRPPGLTDRVTGRAESNSTIRVYSDSTKIGLIADGIATGGTFDISIGNNVHPMVFVTATDAADNEGAGVTLGNDIAPPAQPLIRVLQNAAGTLDRVTGSAEARSLVRVYDGPSRASVVASGTATAGTFDLPIGDNTTANPIVTATDAAGNESAGAAGANDIVPPGAPIVTVVQRPPGQADRVQGRSVSGALVRVYDGASKTRLLASGTAGLDGSFDLAVGDNASATFFVTATRAGDESDGTRALNDISIAAPSVAVAENPPGVADRVAGTVEAGASVFIFTDSSRATLLASAPAPGGTFELLLGDNAIPTLFVTAIDAAGNASPGVSVSNDIVAPAVPALRVIQSFPGIEDRISVTGEAGTLARVFADAGRTKLAGSGVLPAEIPIGDNARDAVFVTVIDAAGNESGAAVGENDITPPALPSASLRQNPPGTADRLTVTAEAGSTVRVYADASRNVLLQSGGPGFGLGDNRTASVFVTAIDPAGNESAGVSLENDIVAPLTPVIRLEQNPAGVPDRVSGVAEPGALVRVYQNAGKGTPVASGTAQGGVFDFELGDNACQAAVVTATDGAGNESPAAVAVNDVFVPAAPSARLAQNPPGGADRVSGFSEAGTRVRVYSSAARNELVASALADDGTYDVAVGDNAHGTLFVAAADAAGNEGPGVELSNDIIAPAAPAAVAEQSPPGEQDRVTGTAERGAVVSVYSDPAMDRLVARTLVPAGSGTFDLPVGNNELDTLFVTAKDPAGNESVPTRLTNDVVAPLAPAVNVVQSPPGTVDRVSGTSEQAALVRVYADSALSVPIVSGTAAGGLYDLAIGDNVHGAVFVTATDAAGNESDARPGLNNIVLPGAPTAIVLAAPPGSADGVAGAAKAGEQIRVYASQAKSLLVTQGVAGPSGAYGPLDIGDNRYASVFVTATTAGSNEGPGTLAGNDIAVAPPVLAVTSRPPGDADRVAGTCEARSTVRITAAGGSSVATQAAPRGTFDVGIGDNVQETVSVTVVDAAGNVSRPVTAANDIAPPAPPSASVLQNPPGTEDVVSGSAQAGSTVRVYGLTGPAIAGVQTVSGSFELAVGDNAHAQLAVSATDAAGNESLSSLVTNDVEPPPAPEVSVRMLPPGTPDRVTALTEPAALVRMFDGADLTRQLASGTSVEGEVDLEIGDNATSAVYVTAADPAGNASPAAFAFNDITERAPTVVVEQNPPGTPDRAAGRAATGNVVRVYAGSDRRTLLATAVAVAGGYEADIGDNAAAEIFVTATDFAGNESGAVGATNDIAGPLGTIELGRPAPLDAGPLRVTARFGEPLGSAPTIQIGRSGGAGSVQATLMQSTNDAQVFGFDYFVFPADGERFEDGPLTLRVEARDAASNAATALATPELATSIDFTIPLGAGLSAISLPVRPAQPMRASELGANFVARTVLDASGRSKFQVHVPGLPDFELQPGEGYLVSAPAARSLVLADATAWPLRARKRAFGAGPALLGLPSALASLAGAPSSGPTVLTSSVELSGALGSRFLATVSGGKWNIALAGLSPAMPILSGQGYLASVPAGGAVTLELPLAVYAGANRPPSVTASANPAVLLFPEGASIRLSGAAQDLEGGAISYRWRQIRGDPVELSTPLEPAASFVAPRRSDFAFVLEATGAAGLSAQAIVEIPSVNRGPTAVARRTGEGDVRPPATVELDGAASSDPDGDPLAYRWTVTPARGASIAAADLARATLALGPDASGSYRVELTVSERSSRLSSTSALLLTVSNPEPPRVSIVAGTPILGQPAALSVAGAIEGLSYSWTLARMPEGASDEELTDRTLGTARLRPSRPGEYEIRLTVTGPGGSATASAVLRPAYLRRLNPRGAPEEYLNLADGQTMVRLPQAPELLFDRTEITNEQYSALAGTGPISLGQAGLDGPQQPVAGVTLQQAREYASLAGKRLPTEAEWLSAATGRRVLDPAALVSRLYPWGDEDPTPSNGRANYGETGDGGELTTPAGSYPAGAAPESGLLDLAGNVAEWTDSKDEEGRPVARGGSHRSLRIQLRNSLVGREAVSADVQRDRYGFRCALTFDEALIAP